MKSIVADDPRLDGFVEIDSAGIGAWHTGQLPDSRMRKFGASRGYDFSSRARQVKPQDFDRFDYVFAMDHENVADLNGVARNAADRKKILCLAFPILFYAFQSYVRLCRLSHTLFHLELLFDMKFHPLILFSKV